MHLQLILPWFLFERELVTKWCHQSNNGEDYLTLIFRARAKAWCPAKGQAG